MSQNINELFFLIKQTDLQLTQLFDTQMAISLTRYEMMMRLKEVDSVSQSYLQEKLKINQAAITRHLKILEEKNYITRTRNPENNREVLVQLTMDGRKLLDACCQNKETLVTRLFSNFTEEQLETTLTVLNGLNNNAQNILDSFN